MKIISIYFFILLTGVVSAQNRNISKSESVKVFEIDNSIFKGDKYWRGADGAATIDLENGKILWLFSDTFIDADGTGKRLNAKMINNSIAIQNGKNLKRANLKFYTGGTKQNAESFFDQPGETWFWTGHGVVVKGKLVIFLFEETRSNEGLGFKTVGWSVVIVDNPNEDPVLWKKKYIKGPDTFGVIVGSSAVLKDSTHIYAYGVKEPGEHSVYLLRFDINQLLEGEVTEMEWWVNNTWKKDVDEEPKSAVLFNAQTEFSVHFDKNLKKYVQIQTYGFGNSPLCYRLSERITGPWSEPVLFFQPQLQHSGEFVYTANAHPEMASEYLYITYNINNFDFETLVGNEKIYFPKIIKMKFKPPE